MCKIDPQTYKMNAILDELAEAIESFDGAVNRNFKIKCEGFIQRLRNCRSGEFYRLESRSRCSVCKEIINTNMLAEHTVKCREAAQFESTKKRKKNRLKHQVETNEQQDLTELKMNNTQVYSYDNCEQEYASERELDATRDHYVYRDNGRFGSASSHDDFDDESTS